VPQLKDSDFDAKKFRPFPWLLGGALQEWLPLREFAGPVAMQHLLPRENGDDLDL